MEKGPGWLEGLREKTRQEVQVMEASPLAATAGGKQPSDVSCLGPSKPWCRRPSSPGRPHPPRGSPIYADQHSQARQ